MSQLVPFFMTIPHSGENIPDICDWLQNLDEKHLMCDSDRFVDKLYDSSLKKFQIPFVKTDWHRYAVDLNRIPTDVDESTLEGSENKSGQFSRGYHWSVTTKNQPLLHKPVSLKTHQYLTDLIFKPFHTEVQTKYSDFRKMGFQNIYHLDAHSMPSVGTNMHKDPGELRADIVISDSLGKSCSTKFRDLVMISYLEAGFKVAYNWPYIGGRLTEEYGRPQIGQHTIQVELNRRLYMDEVTKKINPSCEKIILKLEKAVSLIKNGLQGMDL
jgi:N-formylglutamate deformylase